MPVKYGPLPVEAYASMKWFQLVFGLAGIQPVEAYANRKLFEFFLKLVLYPSLLLIYILPLSLLSLFSPNIIKFISLLSFPLLWVAYAPLPALLLLASWIRYPFSAPSSCFLLSTPCFASSSSCFLLTTSALLLASCSLPFALVVTSCSLAFVLLVILVHWPLLY